MRYLRPLLQRGSDRPDDALNFCDPKYWFTECAVYTRDGHMRRISAHDLREVERIRLTHPRAEYSGFGV